MQDEYDFSKGERGKFYRRDAAMDESEDFTSEERERIRAHIRARGLRFEAFLPESLADWLRAKIEAGVYKDAGEAAFCAFRDLRELDRHPRIRKALLKAMVLDAVNDPRPGIPLEEVRARHQARLRRYASTEPPAAKPAPSKPLDAREALAGSIAEAKREARASGLTDEEIDAELACWRK